MEKLYLRVGDTRITAVEASVTTLVILTPPANQILQGSFESRPFHVWC